MIILYMHAHANAKKAASSPIARQRAHGFVRTQRQSASGVVPKAMAGLTMDTYDADRENVGWRNRSAAVVDLDDLIAAVFAGFEDLGVLENTYAIFSP